MTSDGSIRLRISGSFGPRRSPGIDVPAAGLFQEQSRQEVGRNRGEPEAARDEAEHAEDDDCDGEVAELHPLVGHPDATASMLEGRIERRAHDRVSS